MQHPKEGGGALTYTAINDYINSGNWDLRLGFLARVSLA